MGLARRVVPVFVTVMGAGLLSWPMVTTPAAAGSPVVITTSSLPPAYPGIAYGTALAATGASGSSTWVVVSGTLPVGIRLQAASGRLSGTPSRHSLTSTVTFGVAGRPHGPVLATAVLTLTVGIRGVTGVSAGTNHTCALVDDGTVDCWGWDGDGQLGGTPELRSSSPAPVPGVTDATEVSAGWDRSCALLVGGTVDCWGAGSAGQLGNGAATNSSVPVAVSGPADATDLSVGLESACVVRSGGGVDCWGVNVLGQLGSGPGPGSPVPIPVGGLTGVGQVSTSGGHACAVLTVGTVACWGANLFGQLGDRTIRDSPTPVPVS